MESGLNYTSHWDTAYDKTPVNQLGWYEESPEPSLRLIESCELSRDASILNVGVGASTLIDELLKEGYNNLIANDLSASALDKLKLRLGEKSNDVKWVVDDLTSPKELHKIPQVDMWHDRAVLHFFNEAKEQDQYFNLIRKVVKKNGFVILATFNLEGATKCCGLPVHRYSEEMMQDKLGKDFMLITSFNHVYIQPSGGTRNYVYTLFQKMS